MGKRIAGALLLLLIFSTLKSIPVLTSGALENIFPPQKNHPPLVQRRAGDAAKLRAESPSRGVPDAYIRDHLGFLSFAPADSIILLKGIGPVLAERITRARSGKGPFTSWKDLLSVKGIGPKKILMLKRQAGIAQ